MNNPYRIIATHTPMIIHNKKSWLCQLNIHKYLISNPIKITMTTINKYYRTECVIFNCQYCNKEKLESLYKWLLQVRSDYSILNKYL